MEISKEQKEAIEYLEKYTKLETYGERNLEKDIITVLELLKETQRKLENVNDYNYWVLLAVDRGIELKKLQKKNEKYKQFFDLMLRLDSDYFMNCGDEETNELVDEILKLESEE